MFCQNCGTQIDDNAKFCPNCGKPVINTFTSIPSGETMKMKCKTCGGTMNADENNPILVCPFCGSKELILENDNVTIERIRNKTYKEIESEKTQAVKDIEMHRTEALRDVEIERIQLEKNKAATQQFLAAGMEREERKEEARAFRNTKMAKATLVFFVIFLIAAAIKFSNKEILAGIIAVFQLLLLIIVWLSGNRVIKSIHGLPTILFLLAICMILPFNHASGNAVRKAEQEKKESRYSQALVWPTSGPATVLPEPSTTNGEIEYSRDDLCMINLYRCNQNDYSDYVDACKAAGFTLIEYEHSNLFNAYNDEYYNVSMYFNETEGTIDITAKSPEKMSAFHWPETGPAQEIPLPKSGSGHVNYDTSTHYSIDVADTSFEEFSSYVESCEQAGFNENYSKQDDSYRANKGTIALEVKYNSNIQIMSIDIKKQD